MRTVQLLAFLLATLATLIAAFDKEWQPTLVAASLACWFAIPALQIT